MNVPEVIYFEHCYEPLQRSVMLVTEVKGYALNQSVTLPQATANAIVREAGRDLARINSIAVAGFGWIKRDWNNTEQLRAEHPTFGAFALEYWDADLTYLAEHVLSLAEIAALERLRAHYHAWLEEPQAFLAHGDFDTSPIFLDSDRYSGIIDFGEIRGANRWYDLAHFHMRDGEYFPHKLLPALLQGYQEITSLSPDYMEGLHFSSLLINVRALARSLQKRPANRYTAHQVEVLRRDLTSLR